jgi:hypothetical protein
LFASLAAVPLVKAPKFNSDRSRKAALRLTEPTTGVLASDSKPEITVPVSGGYAAGEDQFASDDEYKPAQRATRSRWRKSC